MSNLILMKDMIGLAGVVVVLLAFFLLNMSKLNANHLTYQFLNLVGSVLILFSLYFDWNTSAVVIEVAWIIVSGLGIIRILKTQKS